MENPLPEKGVNLNELGGHELREFLSKHPEVGFDEVKKKISLIESELINDGPVIRTIRSLDLNYTITPLSVGPVFHDLNKYDLVRDGFITIGGEASTGKTSFATQLALNIIEKNPGRCLLMYSLDDAIQISAKRILSQKYGKNVFRAGAYEPYLKDDEVFFRVGLLDTLSPGAVGREARQFKQQTNSEGIVIIVDYLQAIPPSDGFTDRRHFLNDTLMTLKRLQVELQDEGGCAFFCLSQLNRSGGEGYRYRESSEIENQSDICFDISMTDDGRIIEVKKNKLGRRGLKFMTDINEALCLEPLEEYDKATRAASVEERLL